jgi:hypothetical protein
VSKVGENAVQIPNAPLDKLLGTFTGVANGFPAE